MGGSVLRAPHQESVALVQIDWDGTEVWRFDRTEQVQLEDGRRCGPRANTMTGSVRAARWATTLPTLRRSLTAAAR